jgi:hypothetical protein
MQEHKYFFAVFGRPRTDKHPVDYGLYTHKKGHISNSKITSGDIVLLYCAGSYNEHQREAPGIGVVLNTETGGEKETFSYRYLPFDYPLDWGTISSCIPELKGHTVFNWIGNWLRKISNDSFKRVLTGRQINWP